MTKSTLKSAFFLCLGASPGIALFLFFGKVAFIVVAILGAFVGLALSWPSTSVRNIVQLTTEMIVDHNVPFAGEMAGEKLATSLFGKRPESNNPVQDKAIENTGEKNQDQLKA